MVGAQILDRFKLTERLGGGGFGTVYRGWDERLERYVAVKAIETGRSPPSRVLREAQAAARLAHPGIVTLYELGEEDGHAFLVSELVEGPTLAETRDAGRLSDRDVAEIGADLCEALDHAHARGVVHRDIKPQNVLLTREDPCAKLMDFGIARVLDGPALTATGDVVGTLAYMSPEQAEGAAVGPQSDTYSLALTLYECWTGENPHARGTPAATARAIAEPPRPLARLRRDLPDTLCTTVDACLDPDPALRPTVEDLGEVLEESAPHLDDHRTLPAFGPGWPLLDRLTHRGAANLAPAAAIGGLTASAVVAAQPGGALPGLLLAALAAAFALLRPRLGYVAAAVGVCAWLLAIGLPGAALLVALLTFPPLLVFRDSGRTLPLPAAAPALGALGLAPLFPALAGLGSRAIERAVLGATGYAWLAVIELISGRKLLFDPAVDLPAGWEGSPQRTLGDVILPTLASPAFVVGIGLFAAAAVAMGILVRGRAPVLDLLGALLWGAGLVAALRLFPGAAGPPPAALAAAVLVVVAAVGLWRAREPRAGPARLQALAAAPGDGGRGPALP